MRVLIFSGTHTRHLFVHQEIVSNFDVCGAVVMERESVLPVAPADIPDIDKKNFNLHFKVRHEVESEYFGDLTHESVFARIPTYKCKPNELNTQQTAEWIKKLKPDLVFIFGVDLIKEPVFSSLPFYKINLHLGLSPWYKGSATLFWPFYNLQPQYAGSTIHQIVYDADAGNVIHQCVPELKNGDGIHDVGAKTVVESKKDILKILDYIKSNKKIEEIKQTSLGRLYLTKDFRPEHLRIIYNLYDNKIVDKYLTGEISGKLPKLVRANFL